MKFLKRINEFKVANLSKSNSNSVYDFSPRNGWLFIVKNNTVVYFYFREAFRLIIEYVENNDIKNNTPHDVMHEVYDYLKSKTTALTHGYQFSITAMFTDILSNDKKLILDTVQKCGINFFWNPTKINDLSIDFVSSYFHDYFPSCVMNLDTNMFFYNGFNLNLLTKKWTPSKNIKITHSNYNKDNLFISYDFQKDLINIDYNSIINMPTEIINSDIYNDYSYIFQSKKYNL